MEHRCNGVSHDAAGLYSTWTCPQKGMFQEDGKWWCRNCAPSKVREREQLDRQRRTHAAGPWIPLPADRPESLPPEDEQVLIQWEDGTCKVDCFNEGFFMYCDAFQKKPKFYARIDFTGAGGLDDE